eukprot:g262.t1
MASLASPPLESAPGDAAAPSPPAPTAESRARAAAARALAASTSSATMMSTAHILEFIASCVEAGVDTSAFDNYRAFVRAVDANQDGNVSRAELYEWLVKNRGAFSNEQLREIRVVMEQPRYVETKYGLEEAFNDDEERADAAASVADEALASGLRMSTSEIFDFIDAAVAAGVDTTAFDTQRAFVKAADKDGNGTVDRGELKAWLEESESSFTKEQIEVIHRIIRDGKRRDTGQAYSESKFGMYME